MLASSLTDRALARAVALLPCASCGRRGPHETVVEVDDSYFARCPACAEVGHHLDEHFADMSHHAASEEVNR